jgi:hypothetical protein
MEPLLLLCIVVIALATAGIVAWYAVSAYLKYRGKGVVYCPETGEPVAVEVDATHAALTISDGVPELRLRSCSRWPEREGCGQECVAQIELAPEECMARLLLTNWYEGKSCIYCGKPFGEINWTDHKPALFHPEERRTVEWSEIQPQRLPAVLRTHLPVCWNCHIAESFRHEHPELVVERPGSYAAHV